jgi:Zn ribbon nucleic-acid-binding protein
VSSCSACPRTAPDGHHLCPLCADQVRGWLAELPHQTALLAEFLAPATAPSQGRTGGTGRAHSPVPVDLRVLVLLGPGHPGPVGTTEDDTDTTVPVHAFLTGWAGHIAYTYPAVHRDPHGTEHTEPCQQARAAGGRSITAWCAWLTAYLPYTLTLPAAAELHHQLGDLIRRVRGLTHTEPRTRPRAAPCPQCDACALVRTDGRWNVHCTACGHHMTPEAYDQHASTVLHTHRTGTAA